MSKFNGKTNGQKCPIFINVFFGNRKQTLGDPYISEESLGELQTTCNELIYEFSAIPFGGYRLSKAFRIMPDQSIKVMPEQNGAFKINVPVHKDDSGKHRFLKSPDNHLTVAALKDNKVEIWSFGLVIFRGTLLKIKHKKYEAKCYRQNGNLIIPGIRNSEKLAKFVHPMMNIAGLEKVEQFSEEPGPLSTEKGFGTVLWTDPFSQKLALETWEGTAFSLFKHITNIQLSDEGKLNIPKMGDKVKIHRLENPEKNSRTTFNKVATSVAIQ